LQRAGEGRLNAWTLGGIAIDQVSKYVPRRSVPGSGSWQAHAQRRAKDAKQAMVLEATAVMRSDKVRLLMVQTFIYSAVMYGAEGHDEGGQESAVVKLSSF
jgi:hypothetical protein